MERGVGVVEGKGEVLWEVMVGEGGDVMVRGGEGEGGGRGMKWMGEEVVGKVRGD